MVLRSAPASQRWVAEVCRVRTDGLSQACTFRRTTNGMPDGFVGHWVIDAETADSAGEYVGLRPLLTIVRAQCLKEFRRHRDIAITPALALPDVDDHAFAVNVTYFEQRNLGPAHARRIKHHQDGAIGEIRSRFDQPRHLFMTQHYRQLFRNLVLFSIVALFFVMGKSLKN